jgi:hypothetical protein
MGAHVKKQDILFCYRDIVVCSVVCFLAIGIESSEGMGWGREGVEKSCEIKDPRSSKERKNKTKLIAIEINFAIAI